jgi:hypothetical protein
MAISDIIKSVIAGPVTNIVGPMRTPVVHRAVIGRTATGPIYGDPVNREALVEEVSETVTSEDGTEKTSSSKFTFFEQFTIKEGDRLILKGVTRNVIKSGGLLDPDGVPYVPIVWTGK